MLYKLSVLACLFPLALFASGVTSDTPGAAAPPAAYGDGSTRTLPENYAPDPELAPLQAKVQECLSRGDYAGAKVYENQVQDILYARQPQRPVALSISEAPPPLGLDANPDVVINPQLSRCTGADYEANGTIWAAAAQNDSAVRVWKSTDHGNSWTFVCGARITPPCLFDRIGLVIGTGDSNFIHVMVIHPTGNGDVYQIRWNRDGSGGVLFPVWVGPDTITDFTFCRDNTSPYFLYASVNEPLRAAGHQNGYMLRSTAFGKNWTVTDSFRNMEYSSIQAGAGSWIYLSTIPNVPAGKGQLNLLWNKSYGTRGQWNERNPKPDTFEVGEPVMAPAFTLPESLAVTWVAYHHSRNGSITNYDILALHSTDGCKTWVGPTTISGSDDMEAWPDLKNYRSTGNAYMNVSFIRNEIPVANRRLYRTWVHASTPTNWSVPLLLSDSQAYRSRAAKPLLAYSPGSTWTGAGCVFVRYPNQYLVWNRPADPGPVSPDSLYWKAFGGTALLMSNKSANPTPVSRTAMNFQYDQAVPCMDPQGNYVYEVYGNNLRRFSTRDGSVTNYPLSVSGGHVCATDGNYIFVPVDSFVHKLTMNGTLVNTTILNIKCDPFSFALVNDTVWASPDRYAGVYRGYASTRFRGTRISEDKVWDVGTGINGTGNIAFDGTYYYVPWIGMSPITFKIFNRNRALVTSGQVTIDPRSVMCRWTSLVSITEPGPTFRSEALAVTPNPVSGQAQVSWSLPAAGRVSLRLYDAAGRLAATIADGILAAGEHRAVVNSSNLARGIYLLRLETGTAAVGRKLVIE